MRTIVEELHAQGKFALEGFNLVPLLLEAGEKVFELDLGCRFGGLQISERRLLDKGVASSVSSSVRLVV